MKKTIFLVAAIAVSALFSCKQNEKHDTDHDAHMDHDSTMMHNDSTTMHSEGKMMDDATAYTCPMHPEVRGTINDICSECGMALEAPKK
jgi:hypothetical protein